MKQKSIGETIILKNNLGLEVTLIEYGARIASIRFNNKEMIVCYPNIQDLVNDPYALGATCGRVANRIENAEYTYHDETYKLSANEGKHCLHGGKQNFANQRWQLAEYNVDTNYVKFTIHSPDGDQGFPGELIANVEYQIIDNALSIYLTAHTNKTSPIDLTNHCYFNLGEANCLDLNIEINADRFLPKTDKNVPNGDIKKLEVECLLNDLSINVYQETWQAKNKLKSDGFDHYFVFSSQSLRSAQASITSQKNQVKMELFTNQLGLHLYSSGSLGQPFLPFSGVCLEAQNYPNAVNTPQFPSPFISPKETYKNQITFKFSAI